MSDGAAYPIDVRYLSRTLLWVVDVAAVGSRLKGNFPMPAALRPFVRSGRIPATRYGALARAIESDPEFLRRLAAAADEQRIGEIGVVWLTRPDGWRERLVELARAEDAAAAERTTEVELRRALKYRDAAELAQARLEATLIELRQRFEAQTGELAEQRETSEQLQRTVDRLTAELGETRTELRRASQRAESALGKLAAAQTERAPESARVAVPELSDTHQAELADLAKASFELSERLAELKRQLVTPDQPARRGRRPRRSPLVRPGGVRIGTGQDAEFLLRAGAAVLVDGYNVAKLMWPQLELVDQREQLIALAEDAVRRFGTDLTVVFDGADIEGASVQRRRLVRVRFSPPDVLADDVIRDEVAAVPVSKPVVVVTDDREIVRDVRAEGADTIASARFVQAVR